MTYFRNWHGYANSGIFFMISASLKLSGKLRVITPETFSPTAVGAISHQYSNSFLTSSLWETHESKKKKQTQKLKSVKIEIALQVDKQMIWHILQCKNLASQLSEQTEREREISVNSMNNWLCDGLREKHLLESCIHVNVLQKFGKNRIVRAWFNCKWFSFRVLFTLEWNLRL